MQRASSGGHPDSELSRRVWRRLLLAAVAAVAALGVTVPGLLWLVWVALVAGVVLVLLWSAERQRAGRETQDDRRDAGDVGKPPLY